MSSIRLFWADELGVTAIEYGMIAAAICLVLIALLPALTGGVTAVYQSVADGLAQAAAP